MDLNLTAYFLLAQVIGTRMLERRRGSIINVGSINGTLAFPQRLAYCVSKAGVNMLTKVLAIEWAASGVRVNCLAPGSVETPFIQGLAAQGILDTQKLPSARRWAGSARPTRWAPPPSSSPATSRRSSPARSSPPTAAGRHTGICRALARCERSFGVEGGLRDRLRVEAVDLADQLVGLRSLARALQQRGDMSGVWARIASPPGSGTSSTSSVDATGTVASVDASSGTITLSDGRVLRATDRTLVYQPTTVQALKPGDRVLVRGAMPATVRAPESRMGTVSRVDAAKRHLVLTDGSVVRVPSSASVHRGSEHVTLGQIEPGAEVVILLAPVPSASPGTTASRPAPDPTAGLDATDVSVVWTPSAATR